MDERKQKSQDWRLAVAEEQVWWERERIGRAEYTVDFKMTIKLNSSGSRVWQQEEWIVDMDRKAGHWHTGGKKVKLMCRYCGLSH